MQVGLLTLLLVKMQWKCAMQIAKSNAGKRKLIININEANIKGISENYLKAPAFVWTSPKKLVDSIYVDHMFQITPLQALNHIRNSLESIGKSKSVSNQLSRYAISCKEYSMKQNFAKTFERLYVVKQGRAQDRLFKEKAGVLCSEAVDSAVDITGRIPGIVKEPTLRKMDVVGHDEMNDIDQNEFHNKVKL